MSIQFTISLIIFLFLLLLKFPTLNLKAENYNDVFSKSKTDALRGFAVIIIIVSHIIQAFYNEIYINNILHYVKNVIINWGGVGVAIFFFQSGFGNYLSLNKKPTLIMLWFMKKVLRLVLSFVPSFILVLFVDKMLNISTNVELVDSFISLRMPNSTTWYLKIQILIYIFIGIGYYFSSLCSNSFLLKITVFFGTIFYFIISKYILFFEDFWWKTSLCFFVGCVVGSHKQFIESYLNKLKRVKLRICFVSLMVVLFSFMYLHIIVDAQYGIKHLISYSFICVISSILFGLFFKSSYILSVIGKRSLDLYLVHIGLFELLNYNFFFFNRSINIAVFLFLSFALAFFSNYLQTKLVCFFNKLYI